ncbi:glycine--tRNA ligase [Mycoplasmatota bacterium]|nr:glycine--tRNA ligase [Mycoplasmatota bacterium]
MTKLTMDKIVAFSKTHGFIYQGSEIYGGLANTWDYGPLGVELKNNIKKIWWKKYIQERMNSYGIDASILMNPNVWVASGHVGGFNDPLMDCKECKTRHRSDSLIENYTNGLVTADGWSKEEMMEYINKNNIVCPNCGAHNYTEIREFNLMFKTHRGVTEDNKNEIYLRPETAQGQFVNFLNVQRSLRAKIPFGIGQVGKAFRNEITPGNFTFRTIEFEQMEYQLFCKPGTDDEFYEFFKNFSKDLFLDLGIRDEHLRYHDHEKLAHYAKAACDIEYLFPLGWGEVNGTHNRTNFDLTQHQDHSKKAMHYLDPETNEKYVPFVIESTIGADRAALMFLCEAYDEETLDNGETREILHLHPALAPYKVSVLPLIKKYHSEKAVELFNLVNKYFSTSYDETGKIGKRYRRQDVIGTPYCITIDDETTNNNTVTLRDRDSMEQITLKVDELIPYLNNKLFY